MAKSSKSFWDGEPTTKSANSAKNSSETSVKSNAAPSPANPRSRSFDFRWLALVVLLVIFAAVAVAMNTDHSVDDTAKVTSSVDVDNGDLKINWDRYETFEIELSGDLDIVKSGTYHLTGSIDDGRISVNAGANGVVRLILDNVTISNSTGPAIICTSGDDLVIELVGNNVLSDAANYSSDYDEDVTSAIYSKADLTFQGDGTLDLTASYQDGIVSKDDLKFNSGAYNITAADDGIRGKDSVYIVDGDFTINSVADAIKSTNETDSGKGFVMVESGNFNLTAGAKGVKAISTVIIYGGTFVINSTDDAVHSNDYIGIVDGAFNIASGDDGMHADRALVVDGGKITIAKSYEGLEAQAVTINGGDISITSSDDGINAGGGADSSATSRPGAGAFDSDANCILTINGGDIYVNASGDGVDSNGWLYFNGGSITIDGPTNNGNGALDSGLGIVMNGGSVIAIGASGMAETLGSSSSVNNVSIYLSSTQSAKTKIAIKDPSGNTVLEHTSAKTFNHIAAGATDFKLGETYTIYLNDSEYDTFTISGITTTVGNNNTNQYNMPGGGNQRR